jgi:hypothetical protein
MTLFRPEFSNYKEDSKNYKVVSEAGDKIKAITVADACLILL